jgi:16S rRNA (cytosine967-C5)-methyltransferase
MRYIWQHIKTIIDSYNGSMPLAHYLKNYFKKFPILGSRDRKMLSAMAYSYYRCSKGFESTEQIETLISNCLAMCGSENLLPPGTEFPKLPFNINALCRYDLPLSQGISKDEWLQSMLVQPNLFIRIRKDNGKVLSLLNSKDIPYTFITDNCISLPNGAKIDTLLPPDTYVVQDASSQKTGEYFTPKKNELWYDCCSGAGGKSLLLKDLEPGVRLTITDKRETIIYNLQQRFKQYRHTLPVAHVTDVANKEQLEKTLGSKQFDNIICDAPCSGSGTWSRTPEQLYFFDPAAIQSFSALQTDISLNVSGHLKPGGRLIYITCSVFKNENEDVVAEIIKQTGMKLVTSQLINGITIHADSMFIATLMLQ